MNQTLEQKTESNLTYRFDTPYDPRMTILYVNVIPEYQCPNSCRFCSRTDAVLGLPNIYENKAGLRLYLLKAPSVDEIVTAVEREVDKSQTDEVAFVGLGEPLLQFELARDSIKGIRDMGYNGRIRIDTDGLIKCWYNGLILIGCPPETYVIGSRENPARELKEAGLDEIRISVNAISPEEYAALCEPDFDNAFKKLKEFVRDCIREGVDTYASFVVGFNDGEIKSRTEEEYQRFAASLGIKRKLWIGPRKVIFRNYVPPISKNDNST